MLFRRDFIILVVFLAGFATRQADTSAVEFRLDCGTSDSPVAKGYRKLTASDVYSNSRGYGWVSPNAKGSYVTEEGLTMEYPQLVRGAEPAHMFGFWKNNLDPIHSDSVQSVDDLVLRADVPEGRYRVRLLVGDLAKNIGSITVHLNGEKVAENVAAWSPGCWGGGNHRRILQDPWGLWMPIRRTVQSHGGRIEIRLSKDQSFYNASIRRQGVEEPAWEQKVAAETGDFPPYTRVGVTEAPYYYCGWPFVHNSLMAVEILPEGALPVVSEGGKLSLAEEAKSPALDAAVAAFNRKDIDGAVAALRAVREPGAEVAKAIVMLWCAGRLETDFEADKQLIGQAVELLEDHIAADPDTAQAAEMLHDAKLFQEAWHIHETRGEAAKGEHHFHDNLHAIMRWWTIPEESPLFDQTQLNLARAEHMLIPYFPSRGTYREIFKTLEKEYPNDRFVKYHLHEEWENFGDGSDFYDWVMKDYSVDVDGAPDWVRAIYPAFQLTVDWAEWWIRYKQQPQGSIGGGWGDDVEIVGLFGYMGYASRDVSDLLVKGTARLVDGLWNYSSVDPELGYSVLLFDAEHTAEFTGNTLGMMATIDYGNPVWIERSMKTAKLMRDLWTDYNDQGHRHFRANFFAAGEVGQGDRRNDSWINYRAIRPANAVLWYNNNPTIGKLITELADGWLAASLSTDRGKPAGVIPTMVAFPDGLIGGHKSENWYTAYTGPGTINQHWRGTAGYKEYLLDLFRNAYTFTRDPKYLEPLRMEFELAAKYGQHPDVSAGYNLQKTPELLEYGKRGYKPGDRNSKAERRKAQDALVRQAPKGSEKWVALQLGPLEAWPTVERWLRPRNDPLPNNITKEDVIQVGKYVQSEYSWRWPMHTTEAGPTDRVGFIGCINPFCTYTGGRLGGPLLEAAVTYENTTRDFAAAVLGSDPQGLRIIYYSLAPRRQNVGLVPWKLETGAKYKLTYGPDNDDDGTMDSVTETRTVDFPQLGTVVHLDIAPRVNYLIEIDQIERGKMAGLAPDPAIGPDDLRLFENRLMVRVHNIGSAPARDVWVEIYDGDPKKDGRRIGRARIPHIEAPLDLDPKTTTLSWPWSPTREKHEIYAVVDPDDTIKNEITTFNNTTHATLPRGEVKQDDPGVRATTSTGRGR